MILEITKMLFWTIMVVILIVAFQDWRAEGDRVKYMEFCGQQHFDPQQCAFLDLLSRVGRP